jgi:gluconate 2-dehydrogenase gamma chain
VAVGTLGAAAGAGSTAWLTGLDRPASPRYLFFTETEAVRLIAICEQLIPRDDTPGATDVGVIDYIDRQLVGALARFQSSYRRGLDSFDRTSLALDHGPFEHLTFERQTAALRRLEAGAVPSEFWTDPSAQAFFELVLDHTRQGFYGSPRHGGNRNYASYRMLGLAYPNVIGRNPGVATGA